MIMKIREKNKGFTLLEILLAIVIVSIGISALIGAYNAGILFSSDIENTDIALNIARQKMEEIKNKNTSFDSIVDAGPSTDAVFQDFSLEVATSFVAGTSNEMKQVDVIVTWDAPGGQANITLTTLVADYVKK